LNRRLCLRPRSLPEVLEPAQRPWPRRWRLRQMQRCPPALRRSVVTPRSAELLVLLRSFQSRLNQRQMVGVSGRVRVTLRAASVRIRAQLAESPASVTPPCGVRAMKGMRRPRSTPYREDDTRPLRALSTKRCASTSAWRANAEV
jgi:hypothetical protein